MAHLNLSRIEDRFPTIYITLISVLLAVELAFALFAMTQPILWAGSFYKFWKKVINAASESLEKV